MDLQRSDSDGVPVFWTETPGPFVGSIIFRVGQADETLAQHGACHLIARLVASAVTDLPVTAEVTVEQTLTTFGATGSAEQVGRYLSEVVRVLDALPWERLDVERRIRAAEAAHGGPGALGVALAMRYGASGYGVAGLDELGLRALDADSLELFRRLWFHRGAAAIALSGRPPVTLDLTGLPTGGRTAAPAPAPLGFQGFPCWFPGPVGEVLVLAEHDRSPAAAVALAIAGDRLRRRLHHDEGLSASVTIDEQVLTDTVAHGIVAAECRLDTAEAVRDTMLVELSELAFAGPDPSELDAVRRGVAAAPDDPYEPLRAVQRCARDELLGREPVPDLELVAAIAALGPADVADALDAAMSTAVWVVPEPPGLHDARIDAAVVSSPRIVTGDVHERAVSSDGPGDRLIVGAEGISRSWHTGDVVTVGWDQLVAVQRWSDGGRVLWGADGFKVDVRPESWVGGHAVTRFVDRLAPRSLWVDEADELGSEPVSPPDALGGLPVDAAEGDGVGGSATISDRRRTPGGGASRVRWSWLPTSARDRIAHPDPPDTSMATR